MFGIEWTKKAKKQLSKIDRSDQKPVYEAVSSLRSFPDCGNVRHLVNHEYQYRLRVGRYRVLFEVTEEIRIITIEEVRKRDERTY